MSSFSTDKSVKSSQPVSNNHQHTTDHYSTRYLVAEDEESETDSSAKTDDELETSGVYIGGYKGPIHSWEHPGYMFLKESSKPNQAKYERLFKIIVVGDATVGKTSFIQRYVNDVFRGDYKGTVGVDFASKILWRSENEIIKLQLWDIAGQERFTWMTRVYYRDAQGCIVMFDLTNSKTFASVPKWKRDVDSKCQLPDGSPLPTILLGNKCELPFRDVKQDEVEQVFKSGNYLGWTEISAKEGLMVSDCMKFLVDAMVKKEYGKLSLLNSMSENNVNIINKSEKKKKCCNI